MYSKQEASQLRREFWTTFGQYMRPVLSAEGQKINWINYKTGEKPIFFRMRADNKQALIAIEITHRDDGLRQLYYDQLLQYRNLLHQVLQEEWCWETHYVGEDGKPVSRIYKEKAGVTIFQKSDWPQLISFLKPRIIALDEFWSSVKYAFEALR